MKNRTLLTILWLSTLAILLFVIGAYILQFREFEISKNPEQWGQFGDYLGGLLNPFISIVNLLILTYLSIRLVKNEDDRNKWTLKELARPYGEYTFIKDKGIIKLFLENIGLGPMIIKELKVILPNGEIKDSFDFIIKEYFQQSESYTFVFFKVTNNRSAIAKDGKMRILELSGDVVNDRYFKKELNAAILMINSCKIEITYYDMYDRLIDTISDSTNFRQES